MVVSTGEFSGGMWAPKMVAQWDTLAAGTMDGSRAGCWVGRMVDGMAACSAEMKVASLVV